MDASPERFIKNRGPYKTKPNSRNKAGQRETERLKELIAESVAGRDSSSLLDAAASVGDMEATLKALRKLSQISDRTLRPKSRKRSLASVDKKTIYAT